MKKIAIALISVVFLCLMGGCDGAPAENVDIDKAVNDLREQIAYQDELSQLTVSVDVLGEMEAIASPLELDVRRYGVVVTKGYKRGLLLPNLDGVDTIAEQIAIAKQKA